MGTRGALGAALVSFGAFAGALALSGRVAERGADAVENLVPEGVVLDRPEGGALDQAELVNPLGGGSAAPLDAPGAEAGEPARERSGPWPPFDDVEPRPRPANVFVRLVDARSALPLLEDVRATQSGPDGPIELRAFRASEAEPELWAIGSPAVVAGERVRFTVRARSGGSAVTGHFAVDVPANGDVTHDEPVALHPDRAENP